MLGRLRWRSRAIRLAVTAAPAVIAAVIIVAALAPRFALPTQAMPTLKQLSADPFNNAGVDHRTEVEPDTYAYRDTIVATFQVGRSPTAGSTDNGWATSKNNGGSWTSGTLPHLTKDVGGTYDRAGDPSVAYDPKHHVWLILSIATRAEGLDSSGNPYFTTDVVVSLSTNGGTAWSDPMLVAHSLTITHPYDKPWIVCDTTPSSPYYGRCYATWGLYASNDPIASSSLAVAYSDNPLQPSSWSGVISTAAMNPAAQPLVQPNGTVIIPYSDATDIPGDIQGKSILSIRSTDGGGSWSNPITVSPLSIHVVDGQMRALPLPSAEIDAAGEIYVVWQDCQFEPLCAANDLVLSTTLDGLSWSAVQRIPIHPIGSGYDEFIPGLAVNKILPTSKGTKARLGLAYYFYPATPCSVATCQLFVGFVKSTDGGQSWTNEVVLAGPMQLTWLPSTADGYMVGDYISVSSPHKGQMFPVFAVAHPPMGSQCDEVTLCDEAMYTVAGGL